MFRSCQSEADTEMAAQVSEREVLVVSLAGRATMVYSRSLGFTCARMGHQVPVQWFAHESRKSGVAVIDVTPSAPEISTLILHTSMFSLFHAACVAKACEDSVAWRRAQSE